MAFSVGDRHADQGIALIQIQSDQTAATWAREILQRCLLDRAVGSGHEYIVIFRILLYRQNSGYTLILIQRQDIDHGPPTGRSATLRNLVDFQPVDLTP